MSSEKTPSEENKSKAKKTADPSSAQYQYEMNIYDYVRVVLKYKTLVIAATVAGVVIALIYTSLQTPRYITHAAFEVRRQGRTGAVPSIAQVNTVADVLHSPEVASRALQLLGIIQPTTPEAEVRARSNELLGRLQVSPARNKYMVSMSVSGVNPESITQEASVLLIALKEYLASSALNEGSSRALSEELTVLDQKLSKNRYQVQNVKDFNFRYAEYKGLLEQEKNIQERIEELSGAIARGEKDEAPSWVKSETRDNSFFEMTPPEEIEQSITAEEKQLWSYTLQDYTARHPLVQKTREQINSSRYVLLLRLRQELAETREKREKIYEQLVTDFPNVTWDSRERDIQIENLVSEGDLIESSYADVNERLRDIRLSLFAQPQSIVVTSDPQVPRNPVYPKMQVNVMAGLIIGFVLGLALAFIRESMDTSIGTIEDVEHYTGLNVIGVVPTLEAVTPEDRSELYDLLVKREVITAEEVAPDQLGYHENLVVLYDPKSPEAEAYRALRTHIEFLGYRDLSKKTLLVSSSGPQEGKTTTISNLSLAFAQRGRNTLVVGCNFRRPAIEKMFGMDRHSGLTRYLKGEVKSWKRLIQKPVGIPNLSIMPSGPVPQDPSELISSDRMKKFVEEVRAAYDIVLFDSPPILPVADSPLLASMVDGVVVVYYVGAAAREALLRAKVYLEMAEADILGVVLNNVMPEGQLGYTYSYRYYMDYYGNPEHRRA